MKQILWLPSWFPNKTDLLSGDFIERHAKAASLNNHIYLLFVLKADTLNFSGTRHIEIKTYNDYLQARIVYYRAPFRSIQWLNRFFSALLFFYYTLKEVRIYLKEKGCPDLVHVHVIKKAGIIALYLKWRYKLSYVITEHWTGFCPSAKPNFWQYNFIKRWIWKTVMKNAEGHSTVSAYLANCIETIIDTRISFIIPNVVDLSLFKPSFSERSATFRFIHVSTLLEQKNPVEIIQAVKMLTKLTDAPFELVVYGPDRADLKALAAKEQLQAFVIWKDETSQEQLAKCMQTSDVLILYSIYETFGCVIIEANACGVPVIVSDIPVLHENVTDLVTGIFVPLYQPALLAEKMKWMMENKERFDSQKIADIVNDRYAFQVIADQFDTLYNDVLDENSKEAL